MKITQGKLMEMIAEALGAALREKEDKKKSSNEPEEPETVSADGVGQNLAGNPDGVKKGGRKKDALPVGTDPTQPEGDVDGMDDTEDPRDPSEKDDASEDEADGLDVDGHANDEPSGKINSELSGQTLQAITIEPKSKTLPGAREVVLTFAQSTDALKILVQPSGKIVFFYRGQLHDIP